MFEAEIFRDDLAGLDGRGCLVEPVADRQLAEEGEQAFGGPRLGFQALGLDGVAGGGEQGLLAQVAFAAGFFGEGGGGHWFVFREILLIVEALVFFVSQALGSALEARAYFLLASPRRK